MLSLVLHLRKCSLLIIVTLVWLMCKPLETSTVRVYQDGDILFQDLDCGPFCDAIEKVTSGYHGYNLSHVGMVVNDAKGKPKVIEANGQGVIITPLATFLNRQLDLNGNPKVIHARLKSNLRKLIPTAIKESKALLGKPYDEVFDINNDSYYCSELLYWAFKNANDGDPIFDLKPMTFVDPETGKTFEIWDDYYDELGVSIPEGLPGLNPGGMSTAISLDILQILGEVSRKKGVVDD